jgi:hypothetical protein
MKTRFISENEHMEMAQWFQIHMDKAHKEGRDTLFQNLHIGGMR